MRIRVWDVLAVLLLLATIGVVVVFATIFTDPSSNLNPFPPPTLPAVLVLPTATNTPYRIATTWTPVGTVKEEVLTGTLAPSSTPVPSGTLYVIPSPTDTLTPTETLTSTPMATNTLTPSLTPTLTYTFTPSRTFTRTSTSTQTPTPSPTATLTLTLAPTKTLTSTP